MRQRNATLITVTLMLSLILAGCGKWQGANSLPLPGTAGQGPGSYTVQAHMPDVDNIQRNSRVRVGDVTVGTVTSIERQGWHALVTMSIDGDVNLPENAVAKLGQTSLLGSKHIELAAPKGVPAHGRLHDGSVIPLASGDAYPTTEQTLSALSLLLNGGGIGQIQEITQELSNAFAGREKDLRDLISQIDIFVTKLNKQTDDIIAASESFNDLVGQVAAQKPVVDKALKAIPDALAVMKNERDTLVDALEQFGKFSALAADTANQTKDNLVKELEELGPVLKSLADAGPALTRGAGALTTYPFPISSLSKWFRGDYANLTAVVDLTLSRLDSTLFTGTRWEGNLTELEMQWGRTIGQLPSPYTAGNPLIVPYHLDQGP
ncbi:virulence factor Mce family protein [Mycobacterium sp. AZCC_0083]|uniref:virulence factor Mce family protein n=1 Tax=Mycobacterium sp. AZCC_0083 TaxID=2735882 RepID=UPI00161F3ECC|nr:virulence factor Mce family protein [Mycobacterium sp. AZCC_0083]MBB5163998.1 phospholipid/cholesterol/gamma-HCH transport system substrate-binding protein [Mycobacterium sp. AZCC_0083]